MDSNKTQVGRSIVYITPVRVYSYRKDVRMTGTEALAVTMGHLEHVMLEMQTQHVDEKGVARAIEAAVYTYLGDGTTYADAIVAYSTHNYMTI